MLRNIDPPLSGELLTVLDEMGHGDRLALVDRNYPAHSSGCTVIQPRGTGLLQAVQAILSVFHWTASSSIRLSACIRTETRRW